MKLAIRAVVSVGILALLLWLLPLHELTAAFRRLAPGIWLLVLLGFIAGHALGIVKWRTCVNAGRGALAGRDAVRCYSAGLFANLCLPSIVGGDVLRATLAARATGRPEAAALGGLTDRVIDVAALGTLVALGGLLAGAVLPGWGFQVLLVFTIVGLAGGIVLLPLALRRPLARWPRTLRRPIGRGLVALRRVQRRPGPAVSAFVMALAIQGSFVLLNAWIGAGIGIDVPLAAWFLAWPLAKVAGLLPISLGGLGVRDATFGALLGSAGASVGMGVGASLIWQTVLIAGGLLGGLLWMLLERRTGVRLVRAAARQRVARKPA